MKKTTFILGLSLSAILAVAGCANNTTNDQAVIDKLSTQLDHITNAVSAVSVANIDEITREDVGGLQFSAQTSLSGASQKTSQIAKNIESNRYQILRKAKAIKKSITGGDLKLGNENARAISELTSSMQRYTNELARTKSDYRNTVRSMAKLEDANTQFDAKLTRLSCCLESRDCYMNNILQSLNNVESILNALENSAGGNTSTDDATEQNSNKNESDWGNKTPEDYANQAPSNSTPNTQNYNLPNFNLPQNFNNSPYGYNCPDGNCYPNTYCPDGNCYNVPANCENGYCYGNTSGVNGFAANRGMFNPSRNTDTYGPGVTNIDTYRYTGNGYGAGYGYGTNGQGMRHFNGSNGVNNVMPTENTDKNDGALVQSEQILEVEKTATTAENKPNETSDVKKAEAEEKDVEKIVSSSQRAENGVTKPKPKHAETLEIETENKVKSVSAAKAENVQKTDNSSAEEAKPAGEKASGEDKVKGHTSVAQADINQDIKELLK